MDRETDDAGNTDVTPVNIVDDLAPERLFCSLPESALAHLTGHDLDPSLLDTVSCISLRTHGGILCTKAGQVWTWGPNINGCIGDGSATGSVLTHQVELADSDDSVVWVGCWHADYSNYALTCKGELYSWYKPFLNLTHQKGKQLIWSTGLWRHQSEKFSGEGRRRAGH